MRHTPTTIHVTKTERRDYESLMQAHLEAVPDQPLLLRLQPAIYDPTSQRYVGVSGGAWTIEINPASQADKVRDLIEEFLTVTLPGELS